tara:strand:+ start:42 stop:488 length:447 start_codon:yes stop_codon:yes gene_type:complete
MANVNIKFNGKDYLLSCDDGQEESLKKLGTYLDKKFSEIKSDLGNIGENKLLLISAIKIVDEFFDLKKKVANTKNDFEILSRKFKEIKSLAIDYKNEKELDINKLKNEMNNFKQMVEDNKCSYEETLEKTAKSIQAFIESTESERNLQ